MSYTSSICSEFKAPLKSPIHQIYFLYSPKNDEFTKRTFCLMFDFEINKHRYISWSVLYTILNPGNLHITHACLYLYQWCYFRGCCMTSSYEFSTFNNFHHWNLKEWFYSWVQKPSVKWSNQLPFTFLIRYITHLIYAC